MANNKVVLGNETLIDLTNDTVNANNLLAGETAHDASGNQVRGNVTVPTALADLTDDSTHRLVTDTEKTTWNAKTSLALGETSSTAYRGDRGKTAYDHASAKGSKFESGLYKITTNNEGHVTGATAVAKADITALGIPAQDTTYTSKGAASGGTDVSLVTTGEKYTWNNKANSSDLSALSTTVSNNNTAQNNNHKVTLKQVATTGWTADTTSQSGNTLYKKTIALSHVYVTSPIVDIGASGVLPTMAQQEAYDLLQYVTINGTTLTLYGSAIPSTAYYINITGVD